MEDFSKLEESLNIFFEDKDLLRQAFCHRSYLNENPNFELGHNERLEFLGDAVLELVSTEYLYINYPEKTEGDLTGWRAALVNTNAISEAASSLDFESFLLLSQGEAREKNAKARKCILANTFESFIGALYLDKGYGECKKFIEKNLIDLKLSEIIKKKLFKDPKSLFQEKAQEILSITPAYKVIEESGPDHMKNFVIGVFLNSEMVTQEEGSSKHEAELKAAKKALKVKGWE